MERSNGKAALRIGVANAADSCSQAQALWSIAVSPRFFWLVKRLPRVGRGRRCGGAHTCAPERLLTLFQPSVLFTRARQGAVRNRPARHHDELQ
eukprot:232265-Chlamydomonas_euryale.AAC.1